jgi:hypothetical protein
VDQGSHIPMPSLLSFCPMYVEESSILKIAFCSPKNMLLCKYMKLKLKNVVLL